MPKKPKVTDESRAAAVAGCGTGTALAAVQGIETAAGLRLALELERRNLARSAVIAAVKQRLREVAK
jgi:hypothetical protein